MFVSASCGGRAAPKPTLNDHLKVREIQHAHVVRRLFSLVASEQVRIICADFTRKPHSTPKCHAGTSWRMQTSAVRTGSPSRRANGFARGLAPALTAHKRTTRF